MITSLHYRGDLIVGEMSPAVKNIDNGVNLAVWSRH